MTTCYNELILFIHFLSYITLYLPLSYAAFSILTASNVKPIQISPRASTWQRKLSENITEVNG